MKKFSGSLFLAIALVVSVASAVEVHVRQPDFRDELGRFVKTPADGSLFVYRSADKTLKQLKLPEADKPKATASVPAASTHVHRLRVLRRNR